MFYSSEYVLYILNASVIIARRFYSIIKPLFLKLSTAAEGVKSSLSLCREVCISEACASAARAHGASIFTDMVNVNDNIHAHFLLQ